MDGIQPLLVSKPSKKDRRAGINSPFLLIPELCCVTGKSFLIFFFANQSNLCVGISDMMRSDFRFMREIAKYTHVDAPSRYDRLRQFAANMHQ